MMEEKEMFNWFKDSPKSQDRENTLRVDNNSMKQARHRSAPDFVKCSTDFSSNKQDKPKGQLPGDVLTTIDETSNDQLISPNM